MSKTGRNPQREPNLQNIPIRTELGRQLRRDYQIPSKILDTVDYATLERRMLEQMEKNNG